MDKLISRLEAAKLLGVSLPTFDRMRQSGKIQTITIGRSVKTKHSDFDEFISALKDGGENERE